MLHYSLPKTPPFFFSGAKVLLQWPKIVLTNIDEHKTTFTRCSKNSVCLRRKKDSYKIQAKTIQIGVRIPQCDSLRNWGFARGLLAIFVPQHSKRFKKTDSSENSIISTTNCTNAPNQYPTHTFKTALIGRSRGHSQLRLFYKIIIMTSPVSLRLFRRRSWDMNGRSKKLFLVGTARGYEGENNSRYRKKSMAVSDTIFVRFV